MRKGVLGWSTIIVESMLTALGRENEPVSSSLSPSSLHDSKCYYAQSLLGGNRHTKIRTVLAAEINSFSTLGKRGLTNAQCLSPKQFGKTRKTTIDANLNNNRPDWPV